MLYNRKITSGALAPSALAITIISLLLSGCGTQATKPVDDKAVAFWPPYPDEPRLQFLTSFERSTDIAPEKTSFDNLIYGTETQTIQMLSKPYGVAMWNGRIYVCDMASHAVVILDLRKHQTLEMGQSQGDNLKRPNAIAISPDGIKYVADSDLGMVLVFDQNERHIKTFGRKEVVPVNVAVWKNELYVVDYKGQKVDVLDRNTGEVLRTIGGPGSEPGQFVKPLGIAVDGTGNVYVGDVLKCTIQKFDREGKLISGWGTVSNKAGGLVRPKHIGVDSQGLIYVVDSSFQNVQLFDQNGQVLTFFGSTGHHPGAMNLPVGLAIHEGDLDLFAKDIHPAFAAERLVLVTNQFGKNKVSVYAMGHLKPGLTVNDISSSKGLVPSGTDEKANRLSLPSDTLKAGVEPEEKETGTAPKAPSASATAPIPTVPVGAAK
jgi:DNA-binding beta-propeller fold protein YncE